MWGDLCEMPEGVETRWASPENPSAAKGGACRGNDGRKRAACRSIKAGETAVLAESHGMPGTLRRIWATFNDRPPAMLRGLRLEIRWDGEEKPAVNVPFADFFCHALGKMTAFENALFSSPEGKSFNCCVPMGFRSGFRMTVTNETECDLSMFFYDVSFTLGDRHPKNLLYFHAYWHRENPTRIGEDYPLLPKISGKGRFLGVNIGVIADTKRYAMAWWGEGEMKFYLDGDTSSPTLCGTGTEDYIGTAWGQGHYSHALQGSPIADAQLQRFGFYRLHLPDPILFWKDIRVEIQQIGCCGMNTAQEWKELGIELRRGEVPVDTTSGKKSVLFEREDDWSSCAWFYLDKPTNMLPDLPSIQERVAGLEEPPPVSTERPPSGVTAAALPALE